MSQNRSRDVGLFCFLTGALDNQIIRQLGASGKPPSILHLVALVLLLPALTLPPGLRQKQLPAHTSPD